jgi:protein-S-isoprenylcysteine O-methyltransferase Ste14
MHLFVVVYEEPALLATFGGPYAGYCRAVHRWWPKPKRSPAARG